MRRSSPTPSIDAADASAPQLPPAADKRLILYVCNDAAYFTAHRDHVARRMLREGWQVHVACGGDISLLDPRFRIHALDVERRRFSPRRDLGLALAVRRLLRRLQPEVVHLITIKPILFGALAVLSGGDRTEGTAPRIVTTFPGLGRVFEADGIAGAVQRMPVAAVLRLFFRRRNIYATFENKADRDRLVEARIVDPNRCVVMAGAGLDLSKFSRDGSATPPFKVLWASRLVRGKGIRQFAAAARLARQNGDAIEFLAAGSPDPGHADNLTATELGALETEPALRFLGHVTAMPQLLASVDAVCLPSSYMEGLPRILIEAAASSLPMIASDVPGCREIVRQDETGILLDEISPEAIYRAVTRLAADPVAARRMGERARALVERGGYGEHVIQDRTLEIYGCAPQPS